MLRVMRYLASLVIYVFLTASAPAIIIQNLFFGFDPTSNDRFNNDDVRGDDRIVGATDADINRALIGGIGSANVGYMAQGSIGVFGNYGISGSTWRRGELHAQVYIAARRHCPADWWTIA